MKRLFIAFLLPAWLFSAAAARAHAMLDRASPAVGSTVRAAPRAVTLQFTQKLEPAFSTVEVRDSAGRRVDIGKARVDPANPTVLRIGLRPLKHGTYRVQWHVLSVDTHTTQGDFSFSVGE